MPTSQQEPIHTRAEGANAEPEWAVTSFSFTLELQRARRTPVELLGDILDAGLTRTLEVDAPQGFRTFPDIAAQEIEAFHQFVHDRDVRLSMLGVYCDLAAPTGRLLTLDEAEAFTAAQIRAAGQLGFPIARIMFGIDPELLRRLARHAEEHDVLLMQELQGPVLPTDEKFDRQREAITCSAHLGFVFDLSACMPKLPLTWLAALRTGGVPERVLTYLEQAWSDLDSPLKRETLEALLGTVPIAPETRQLLDMPFHRFGRSRVSDWREDLASFKAVHLKYWDLDDADGRVSGPVADVRREFGAIGYDGVVTSEWGGHEWWTRPEDAFTMTARHRQLYDTCLDQAPARI
jgi:hypothetical protein